MTRNEQKAASYGEAVAVHEFTTFLNPVFRGPNFRWADFPEVVREMAELVENQFPERTWKRQGKTLLRIALDSAKYQAEFLLRESAVAEWMDLEDEK